jgi:hypothetical protein
MIEIVVNSHVISLPIISRVDLKSDRKKGAYNGILLHSIIIAAVVWSDKGSSTHTVSLLSFSAGCFGVCLCEKLDRPCLDGEATVGPW